MPYPTLVNAPIEEAIIRIECSRSIGCNVEAFFKNSQEYTSRTPIKQGHVQLHIKENSPTLKTEKEEGGIRLANRSQSAFLMVFPNSIQLSVVKPYSNWADFLNKFKEAWQEFTSLGDANFELTSVSLRYINKFLLPQTSFYDDLLIQSGFATAPDNNPEAYSLVPNEGLTRVTLTSSDLNAMTMVTCLAHPNSSEEEMDIILDIDARHKNIPVTYNNFSTIKTILEQLRECKNQIFFANIPRASELFNERT